MIERSCQVCAAVFKTYAAELRKGGGKFCSRRCYYRNVGERQRKAGGHNRKTGTMRASNGYILEWAPDHPAAIKGYVPQHRRVMERALGRLLRSDELVHHRNEMKDDNDPDNLVIMSSKEHMREHRAKWVVVDGETLSFVEACARVGRAPASVRGICKRRGLTHQQAIDSYCRGEVKPWWTY